MDTQHDAKWLRRMTSDAIAKITLNGGGTSLTLRVYFTDGRKAVFKPHQKNTSSNYRAEIAAYHLDRILGFRRVAPVAGRPISLSWLKQQFANDPPTLERIEKEIIADEDRVWGAMIAWHTRTPTVADPPRDWLSKINPPADLPDSPEPFLAWSDMVLFDALIDNTDRWSGGNVMTLGPGGPLIFLDNASAFLGYRAHQHAFLSKPTEQLCRFRPSMSFALHHLAPSAPPERRLSALLSASLSHDPAAPVVSPTILKALDERHDRLLRQLDGCHDRFGTASVLGGH